MFFLKEHLIGKTYEWPENKSAVVRSTPGMQLFDRLNGDHLLYMINFFCTSIGAFSISEGQKIENLISKLPFEVDNEIGVFNWLRGKYLFYRN
jgi:hypothetical protein